MEPGAEILNAIDSLGLQARGTLREWMIQNHDAFAIRLERFKPDWTALAKVFADAGLTDRRGKPPTAEATRKTWQRVRKARADRTDDIKTAARVVIKSAVPTTQPTKEIGADVSNDRSRGFSYDPRPGKDTDPWKPAKK